MPESAGTVIKCVVVGDGAVGKTCLLISYAKGSFPVDYVPTVFDNYAVQVPVGDRNITLNLFDTAGQEDYDRLRPMSYTNASVFLVCFSVASRSSFENVADKWVPELKKYAKGVPFILVGTQSDRRNGAPANRVVGSLEGVELAKKLGAVEYAECSAKTREGLRDVFVGAIMTSTYAGRPDDAQPQKGARPKSSGTQLNKKKSGCSIF